RFAMGLQARAAQAGCRDTNIRMAGPAQCDRARAAGGSEIVALWGYLQFQLAFGPGYRMPVRRDPLGLAVADAHCAIRSRVSQHSETIAPRRTHNCLSTRARVSDELLGCDGDTRTRFR